MMLKLLIYSFLVILNIPATLLEDASSKYAIQPKAHPYLALLEIKQPKARSNYYNGLFLSLKWVMTDSAILAQKPTGKPANDSFFVYGGLGSLNKIDSAHQRKVETIVTDMMSEDDNKYFPNLVLLLLESSFPKSNTLMPANMNIGMLTENSLMVGWAKDLKTGAILSQPVAFPAKSLSSEMCSKYNLLEFMEQLCSLSKNHMEEDFLLFGGALLVDNSQYVTGMMQFHSYLKLSESNMPLMILVRLSYFKTFWQYNVADTKQTFLETDFADDLIIDPWIAKDREEDEAGGPRLHLFSHWTWVLNTSFFVFIIFLHRNHNFILN